MSKEQMLPILPVIHRAPWQVRGIAVFAADAMDEQPTVLPFLPLVRGDGVIGL